MPKKMVIKRDEEVTLVDRLHLTVRQRDEGARFDAGGALSAAVAVTAPAEAVINSRGRSERAMREARRHDLADLVGPTKAAEFVALCEEVQAALFAAEGYEDA